MELLPPLRRALLQALNDIFREGHPADKVIQFNLKSQKKWGSRDRRQYAETVYGMVRWWRRLTAECNIAWEDFNKDWTEQEFGQILEYWFGDFDVEEYPQQLSMPEKYSFTDYFQT